MPFAFSFPSILHDFVPSSGPGLLGEGPLFLPPRFAGKDAMLDLYRTINKRVCEEADITYIDLRKAFQEALPSVWLFSRWYVTSDGEHPNEKGTQIIADAFGGLLSQWLRKE